MNAEFYEPAVTHPESYSQAAATGTPVAATATEAAPCVPWHEAFARGMMNGQAFLAMEVPERQPLLGSFLRAGDLGFVYAPRGVGKTWLALLMAGAMGRGEALGEWEAGAAGPLKVCYVDGEVNLPDAIERASLVQLPDNVHWLHHETIADLTGQSINLVDPEQQDRLLETLLALNIEVLFLDNLSCLFRGMAENEADEWEKVLTWLLALRRHSITVILVAHAGRNGEMRGTSRREDTAHWIIKLEEAADLESTGAQFKSTFTKNRNARQAAVSCPPLRWTLETVHGELRVTCVRHSDMDKLVELVRDGISRAGEIAVELNISPATVSRWARRAADSGLIRIEGREYLPA